MTNIVPPKFKIGLFKFEMTDGRHIGIGLYIFGRNFSQNLYKDVKSHSYTLSLEKNFPFLSV